MSEGKRDYHDKIILVIAIVVVVKDLIRFILEFLR